MKNNIQDLTFTALMAAMICLAGPIVIPVGMVPVSFVNMAIYLAIILLDGKKATISILMYLLLGFVGIPVFAGFTSGLGKLAGPTGGYLLAYPLVSWIAGSILKRGKAGQQGKEKTGKRFPKRKEKKIAGNIGRNSIRIRQVAALMTGTVFLYLAGTFWLMYQSKLNFKMALAVGVFPFMIFDVIKILLAVMLGNAIKHRISSREF